MLLSFGHSEVSLLRVHIPMMTNLSTYPIWVLALLIRFYDLAHRNLDLSFLTRGSCVAIPRRDVLAISVIK